MPYYLFKISATAPTDLVKKLELLDQFEQFREAKNAAKQLRKENVSEEDIFKVVFAESQLQAEELLMEKRERPVLMEYER